MADNIYDYVQAKDVRGGYHIPSGRKVHTDSKGRLLISNVGYSGTDGISAGSMPVSSRQPYDPNAAKPRQKQTSYGASDQANKTRAVNSAVGTVNSAVGNWWQGLQQGGVGGAGAMSSGRTPTGLPIDKADYSSGLPSNKIVVDGVTYDMDYPEHKKLMNSRVDLKIKGQREKAAREKAAREKAAREKLKKETPLVPPSEPPSEPLTEDATVSKITNPSNPPRNAAEFGDYMQTLTDKYKIKFPGEQERNGYQSIYLPGTRSAGEDESAADNKVMGMAPQQAIDRVNGGSTEIVIGGNMGAQTGTSSAPDKGDQSRIVKGFNGHEFGGEHEAPPTIFRDKRSRAILDYDGDGGMMGAMRAAEAAQNTIKQNGVLYALDGEGKGTALDEDTAREFKKDGNKMASQEFLRNYRYPETPAESQSADSLEPEMPISDINKDTGAFTSGMESNVIKDPSEAFRALGLNVRR